MSPTQDWRNVLDRLSGSQSDIDLILAALDTYFAENAALQEALTYLLRAIDREVTEQDQPPELDLIVMAANEVRAAALKATVPSVIETAEPDRLRHLDGH